MRTEVYGAIDERKLGIEKRQEFIFHIYRSCASSGPL